jgi:uncharacterized protein YeaO (DUF488 family)
MAGKRGNAGELRVKRIYDPAKAGDGFRVLVDRLWPRGVSKDKARIDAWMKDIAPSDALRRRAHGDPEAWEAFVIDYHAELQGEAAQAAARILLEKLGTQPVTLLYAARNEERNNALALKAWLEAHPAKTQ